MAEFKSRYTDEFQSAVDVVCGACPYRVDACGDQGFEVDEKYCGRCMVRLMCDLFIAERDAQSELADEYPEVAGLMNPTLPDEKARRVGQSVAAASLPELR